MSSANLSDWISRRAAMHPERMALSTDEGGLNYRCFDEDIARVSGMLRNAFGVSAGDRVAYLGHNSAFALKIFFAAARLGAIYMPLNWRLAPPELAFMLRNGEPTVLFAQPDFVSRIDGERSTLPGMRFVVMGAEADGWRSAEALLAGVDPCLSGDGGFESPVLLCYTSGTTGRPKGAVLSQEAIFFNAVNSTHMHDLTSADRVLSTLPLFHVGGLNIQTVPAFHAGASVFLHSVFDPEKTLEMIAAERITLTVLVPAQISALLSHPKWGEADLSSLKAISTGSTIVPKALIERVHARGIPVIQVYGSTETAPIATYQTAKQAFDHVGSTGKAALHCDVKVVGMDGSECAAGTPGEILVRGPSVFSQYWRDEIATREAFTDGWFRTGDVGHFDETGELYIDDRIKDMIISGGENIYPAALEQILLQSPDIVEAAVVARADEQWGEVPVAVVVLRPDAEMDAAAVLRLFEDRVARYQHPKAVIFTEALPRNAMGKVQKETVRGLVR